MFNIYVNHEHFLKKKSIILALFWQKNKHCFKNLMLFFTSTIGEGGLGGKDLLHQSLCSVTNEAEKRDKILDLSTELIM